MSARSRRPRSAAPSAHRPGIVGGDPRGGHDATTGRRLGRWPGRRRAAHRQQRRGIGEREEAAAALCPRVVHIDPVEQLVGAVQVGRLAHLVDAGGGEGPPVGAVGEGGGEHVGAAGEEHVCCIVYQPRHVCVGHRDGGGGVFGVPLVA